jgi:hypothetical protein
MTLRYLREVFWRCPSEGRVRASLMRSLSTAQFSPREQCCGIELFILGQAGCAGRALSRGHARPLDRARKRSRPFGNDRSCKNTMPRARCAPSGLAHLAGRELKIHQRRSWKVPMQQQWPKIQEHLKRHQLTARSSKTCRRPPVDLVWMVCCGDHWLWRRNGSFYARFRLERPLCSASFLLINDKPHALIKKLYISLEHIKKAQNF